MAVRITKALLADGWVKNGKLVGKACAAGGFVCIGRERGNARFCLTFTDTKRHDGLLKTYDKGDYPNLDDARVAGNAMALSPAPIAGGA